MKLVNVNEHVLVKLTEEGKKIIEENHKQFQKNFPMARSELRMPVEDEDGYSKWQMWSLMQTFGPHIYLGCVMPFDAQIIIP